LYCFFAMEHNRRRILHFNVTLHPTRLDRATTTGGVPGAQSLSVRPVRP
jgi:hypothetical protein